MPGRNHRVVAVALALSFLGPTAAAAQELAPTEPAPPPTTAAPDPLGDLRRLMAGLPPSSCLRVSVDGVPVVDHQGALAVIPASNQKLLTAAWALATAPDLVFTTRVTATAREGGRAGVLHLVGGADPMLATDAFARRRTQQYGGAWATSLDVLADRVAAAGITEVGALVGDGSILPRQRALPQWRPVVLDEGHTGPLGGLTVNHGFAFDARDPAGARWSPDPDLEAVRHLAALLRDRGVRVGWLGTGPAPAVADEVASVTSRPVRDLVAEVLVESDNNTAEGLLQGIGRLVLGTDGSVAAGAAAVQAFLAERGLLDPGAVAVDGSGLSRENRTTCAQLHRLLDAAGPDSALAGSLAVACRTGTLERYLCQGPAAGVLRAKTGTLGVSKALSGFVTSASGRRVTFSFVVNGPNAPAVGTAAWGPLADALSQL